MEYPFTLIAEQVAGVNLLVPNAEEVRLRYLDEQKKGMVTEFPFWTRIWPSSIAMALFLEQYPEYIGERVLELGAGMGVPSFTASRYASSVVVSDYLEETVCLLQKNILRLGLSNVTAQKIDWNHLPEGVSIETLLLSDINYAPSDFESLLQMIEKFIYHGVTVILSTPLRIAGKSFMNYLVPYIVHRETTVFEGTDILVVILRKNN